jgi:hypothetical protein
MINRACLSCLGLLFLFFAALVIIDPSALDGFGDHRVTRHAGARLSALVLFGLCVYILFPDSYFKSRLNLNIRIVFYLVLGVALIAFGAFGCIEYARHEKDQLLIVVSMFSVILGVFQLFCTRFARRHWA